MKTNRKSHSPAVTYTVRRGAPLSSAYRNSAAVLPWMLCAATLIATAPARAGGALPTNGQYVAGQGSITSTTGSITVNQSSSHGIINWQGFSIGQGNSVLFNNGSGATLNRVTGNQLSQIDGSLSATGSVYLINPQGIVIGRTGQVIANGSFVASTRDVSNNAFMSGQPFSASGTSNGSVINQGVITSNNGDAILVGQSVTNTGSISASNGTVGLAAGNQIMLQPAGSDSRIAISGGTGSVTNSGNLKAAQAELNAAGGNVYAIVENNGGAISATGTQTINGHVWLTAGGTGTVTIAGAINAQNANGNGGDVTVRGTNISVPGSVNASAITANGAGGSVSVVASNSTSVTGAIHARGGASGLGGSIETSGHSLSFGGANIDAGKGGNWLLDPYDLTVDQTAATTIDGSLGAGTSVTLQTTATGASGPGNQNPSGNGDIFVNSAINWNTSATLTLSAYRNVDVLAPITVGGAGGIVINTGSGGSGGALSFGLSSSGFAGNISYGATNNGGTLQINGTAYTLLYSMSDVQNINNNLTGNYALADSIDASSVGHWTSIGTDGASSLIGQGFTGTFEGLGNTISNLRVDDNADYAGLFGAASNATIRDIGVVGGADTGFIDDGGLIGFMFGGQIVNAYATGTINGDGNVGGLVGESVGVVITDSFATGAVNSGTNNYAGGLVGLAEDGTIADVYATGAVTGGGYVGGLIGQSNSTTISNVYATGAVSGTSFVAGLLGAKNNGALTNGFATGAVTGTSNVGGLIGGNGGPVTNGYWDMGTTGLFSSFGGNGQTTAQLQGALPSGFDPTVWGTGPGLYPYLLWQYPTGTPQAVSGIAYSNFGVTPMVTGPVTALLNGNSLGTTITGANGYYYLLEPAGTITANSALLAMAGNGVRVDSVSGTTPGFDVWNNTLIAPTSATTYSLATATTLQAQDSALIAQAVGANTDPTVGLTNYGYIATGSFTIDQQLTLPNSLYVAAESANASITVSQPITLQGANTLELNAAGALTIDAPVTVSGAGNVVLGAGYDTTSVPGTSLLELSFGLGVNGFAGSLNFAAGTGEGIVGQSLTINGAPYTLLYSMGDVQNINNNLGGNFALVTSLNAATDPTTPASWAPVGGYSGFYGSFDGLGHTISNLTVNTSGGYAGLFGSVHGTVRDIGLTGGSVSGGGNVGGLAGNLSGTISNSYFSGTVNLATTESFNAGGLVGSNNGTITNSYTTGTVTDGGYNFEAGGLAGTNQGKIDNSYSTVTVNGGVGTFNVGGLVGENFASISNSYFAGTVNGSIAVGGLAGANQGTLSNSFYDVDQVLINGAHVLTAGGIYDAQYQDWIGHNLSLNIANYFAAPDANGVYSIGSAQDVINLLGFAEVPGLQFKLKQNIDLAGNPGLFIPYFAGASLDGQNHVVSNLTVDQPLNDDVGLIGRLVSGTIKNIGVVNANVSGFADVGALIGYSSTGSVTNAYATGTVTATGAYGFDSNNIGGLGGYSSGSISNSYAAVSVNAGANSSAIGGLIGEVFGANITSSYATGNVTVGANSTSVGGLVGLMSGNITGSHAGGAVTGGYGSSAVGGLVGMDVSGYSQASGFSPYAVSITSSYATGAVNGGVNSQNVGGLIGSNTSGPGGNVTVANDYATGAVTGGGYVGGLVGQNQSFGGTPIVTTSYSIGAVNGTSNVGGLVGANNGGIVSNSYWNIDASGQANSAGGTGLTNAQMKTASSFANWTFGGLGSGATWVLVDADGSIDNANGAAGATTPMLLSEYSTTVSTPHQLQLIALNTAANYTLAGNIDMTGTSGGDVWSLAGFVPIYLTGSFNGQDFTIFHLYENDPSSNTGTGLFRQIEASATVQNLSLAEVDVTGGNFVGALAGSNLGVIENVTVGSPANTNDSTVTGSTYVGGLVGANLAGGKIGPANAPVDIDLGLTGGVAVSNVTVSGGQGVGGVAGWNAGSIGGGSGLGQSAAAAVVSGTTQVGGFVGWNTGSIDSALVAVESVTGSGFGIGGVAGYNGATGSITNSLAANADTFGGLAVPTMTGVIGGSGSGMGGLVGLNAGIISGSQDESLTIGSASTVTSGGFAGQNTGTIEDTLAEDVTVSGSINTGGFVGYNSNLITSSGASSVSVTGTQYAGGFVGTNTAGGVIAESDSSGTVTATGNRIGGFVGWNAGTLNAAAGIGDSADVTVSGASQVGGLVGWNDGTVTQTSAGGTVTASGFDGGGLVGFATSTSNITDSYATGNVGGVGGDLGGLVGQNGGSITNAYATGSVGVATTNNSGGLIGYNTGTVSDVYATGTVLGAAHITGALVGNNAAAGNVSDAYYLSTVNGALPGVGTNKGTFGATAMGGASQPNPTAQATYVGFDFTNVWTIAAGELPTLRNAP